MRKYCRFAVSALLGIAIDIVKVGQIKIIQNIIVREYMLTDCSEFLSITFFAKVKNVFLRNKYQFYCLGIHSTLKLQYSKHFVLPEKDNLFINKKFIN